MSPFALENERYMPLLVLGGISSSLSLVGSACVIHLSRKKLNRIMQRIMFGLSIADVVSSLVLFVMPYMVPSFLDLAGASGNFSTCTAGGFFLHTFATVGCFYNFYLSGYYLLSVRSSWKEHDFTKPLEIFGHAAALAIPIGINTFAAATESFNPSPVIGNVCYYYMYPWNCDKHEDMECQRSNPETVHTLIILRLVFTFIPSALSFAFTFMVWLTVRNTIRRSSSHRFSGTIDMSSESRQKEVKKQAILYSLAYLNTFLWPLLGVIIVNPRSFTEEDFGTDRYYVLQVLFWTLYPLQGFLNFFVYTRLKVKAWRKAEPSRSFLSIYVQILASKDPPQPKRGSHSTSAF